jgi:hypothetical protein
MKTCIYGVIIQLIGGKMSLWTSDIVGLFNSDFYTFIRDRPEVPVIVSIIMETCIMGKMCYSVYKTDKASSTYTSHGGRMTIMVFRKACWFVGAFYVTWLPYLSLQYAWSFGKAYDAYGFILASGTMVSFVRLCFVLQDYDIDNLTLTAAFSISRFLCKVSGTSLYASAQVIFMTPSQPLFTPKLKR